MKTKEIAKTLGVYGLALMGLFETCGPNTAFDRTMAKQVWCGAPNSSTTDSKKRLASYADYVDRYFTQNSVNYKIDHDFNLAGVGDTIKYRNVELKVTDSRQQRGEYVANRLGSDTMLSLKCPGYIEFDVYNKGKLVPGGKGIKINYAAKFIGSGGFFDGWPNFTLEDVLKMTKLSSSEVATIMEETTRPKDKK